jgi:hypothetical protein
MLVRSYTTGATQGGTKLKEARTERASYVAEKKTKATYWESAHA